MFKKAKKPFQMTHYLFSKKPAIFKKNYFIYISKNNFLPLFPPVKFSLTVLHTRRLIYNSKPRNRSIYQVAEIFEMLDLK